THGELTPRTEPLQFTHKPTLHDRPTKMREDSMKRPALIAVLALFMALAGGPAHAQAENPAEFYKGKTVHFIVGLGVGGGFDAYARMIAPYLSKELGTTVVVEN